MTVTSFLCHRFENRLLLEEEESGSPLQTGVELA
jgi:hypothetical protein